VADIAPLLELRNLRAGYGTIDVLHGVDLVLEAGQVYALLGPNGAGKSTTMLMALGVQRPTSGTALVAGRRYTDLRAPMHEVGALLDARATHPARTGRNHLTALATSNGISSRRVDEVLELVGLTTVAGKRTGTYSLGMSQRLGIAGALLGDPPILLLDEPVNGLDPSGITWIRTLLRDLAAEGRTVVISSHLMSEMELTADHLVVVGRGRLIADMSLEAFVVGSAPASVLVRADRPDFAAALRIAGATVLAEPDGTLLVSGMDADRVGRLALAEQVAVSELRTHRASLEEAFMAMTNESVEYR
jgi:ABC-2 type transport system ATP-binding protein